MRRIERVLAAYRRHVFERGNEPRFVAALAFLGTFVLVRLVTFAIRLGIGPLGNVEVGGTHVHHMIPGLVVVLVSGLLDIVDVARVARAFLFGIGAALVLDEFALVLNLADVYWAPQGRESIDAVVIFGAALAVVLLGGDFWRDAWRALRSRV